MAKKKKVTKIKKSIPIGKLLLAAIIIAVIALIVHSISALFSMDYYLDQNNLRLWSPIMMPSNGSPGLSFYALSLGFAFLTWFFYTVFYNLLRSKLPGKWWGRGLSYGLVLFMIVGFPGFLTMYLLLAIPTGLLICWLLENLAIYLIGGLVIAKMMK